MNNFKKFMNDERGDGALDAFGGTMAAIVAACICICAIVGFFFLF